MSKHCGLGLIMSVLLLWGCRPPPRPLPTPLLPSNIATPANSGPTSTVPASATAVVSTTPTPQADSGWQTFQPGLEQRQVQAYATDGRLRETLTILRLDPTHFNFQIAYQPGSPQSLANWQAETGALLVVNGGFFTPEMIATGLTVVNSEASGSSYRDFGGMFAVTDGGVQVRSLREQPYAAGEPLRYALQAFPLLLNPGGRTGFTEDTGAPARRTVVAQDRNGRILFILAPGGSFTLFEMSQFLLQSDLNLHIALNLDGGTSTGLLLKAPPLEIPAFVLLPTVITVFPVPSQ